MRSRVYHPPRPSGAAAHRVIDLVEGDSVRESALEALALSGASRAELDASGRIDGVRLRGRPPIPVPLAVVSLRGVVSDDTIELRLVGVADDGALHAGVLDDARAVTLELALTLWVEVVPEAPAQVVTPSPTWAEVAAASAPVDAAPVPDVPSPQVGDRIVHPSFGETVVEKLDDGDDFVFVRSKTQRLLRLSLEILQLELVDESEGRRRFAARVAKVGKAPDRGRT